jgi:hypothetical protein
MFSAKATTLFPLAIAYPNSTIVPASSPFSTANIVSASSNAAKSFCAISVRAVKEVTSPIIPTSW